MRAALAELARQDDRRAGREFVAEVVGAVDIDDHADADRAVAVLDDVVLALELDGAVGGAIDAELRAAERRVFQLETDLRARVEPEGTRREITEVAVAERCAGNDGSAGTPSCLSAGAGWC